MKRKERSGSSRNKNTEKQCHINEIREDVLKELVTRHTKDVHTEIQIAEIKEMSDE